MVGGPPEQVAVTSICELLTNVTSAWLVDTEPRCTVQPRSGLAVNVRSVPVHVAVNCPPLVDTDRVHGPVGGGEDGNRVGRDVRGGR